MEQDEQPINHLYQIWFLFIDVVKDLWKPVLLWWLVYFLIGSLFVLGVSEGKDRASDLISMTWAALAVATCTVCFYKGYYEPYKGAPAKEPRTEEGKRDEKINHEINQAKESYVHEHQIKF